MSAYNLPRLLALPEFVRMYGIDPKRELVPREYKVAGDSFSTKLSSAIYFVYIHIYIYVVAICKKFFLMFADKALHILFHSLY